MVNMTVAVGESEMPKKTEPEIFVTIHGHFYQPPRENPYLNSIERQDSAAPFHDWNARICYECYRPNGFARVETNDGKLLQVVNNYEYLSFNMGPTLLSWLEIHDPETYERIIAGDRRSAERLNGHGNAIAQVYNHIIMPLANWRDKLTQIRWGKADFRARFGRDPEGMWLAETAVDYETLEALVVEGIKFIILAPSQALRCRPAPTAEQPKPDWIEVSGSQIDPNRPYRCYLRQNRLTVSGLPETASFHLPTSQDRYIDIFFYDGPISRDMGFGNLLGSSHNFASRLAQAVRGDHRPQQIVSVATDGETFGHHKHFTEKTLAYAFTGEFPRRGWQVTNYAHYLSLFPPTWEVELKSVTAWSCAHGVGRWSENCGCAGEGGFHQKWRKPLRTTLNWLRDRLMPIYDDYGRRYFADPWAARDGYIHVLRDSLRHGLVEDVDALPALSEFFARYGKPNLTPAQQIDALRLLEMQRHALLMFTSCGWFFEELSRPEGVQILRYAARAMELAADVAGVLLESEFISRLSKAPSNLAEYTDGAGVYRQMVQTNHISLEQVVAQYAIGAVFNNLFTTNNQRSQVYCYTIEQQDYQLQRMGAMTLAVGQIQLISGITQEAVNYVFAVLHLGGDDFHCCIHQFLGRREYEQKKMKLFDTLQQASAATTILAMTQDFGGEQFNLQSLFPEERHRILGLLARETLTRLDQLYEQVYRDNYGILASFRRDGLPVPSELQVAAQITLNNRLLTELRCLEQGQDLPLPELDAVAIEATSMDCDLQRDAPCAVLSQFILRHVTSIIEQPLTSLTKIIDYHLGQIDQALALAKRLKVQVDSTQAQERLFDYLVVKMQPACELAGLVLSKAKATGGTDTALSGEMVSTLLASPPLCQHLTNQQLHLLINVSYNLAISPVAWLGEKV